MRQRRLLSFIVGLLVVHVLDGIEQQRNGLMLLKYCILQLCNLSVSLSFICFELACENKVRVLEILLGILDRLRLGELGL